MQDSGSTPSSSLDETVPSRSATPGDFVFAQVGERRALAIVDSFDGHRYVVRPRVAGSLPTGPRGTLVFSVAPPAGDQNNCERAWSNAPTPICCVCLEDGNENRNSAATAGDMDSLPQRRNAPARRCMAVLACRCSAPSVCIACARRLTACPQCRSPLHTLPSGIIPVMRLESPVETSTAIRLVMTSLAGKRHQVVASPSWSVRTLKAFYGHVAGAHPKQQTLKYAGATLNDEDRNLASCGLGDGSIIHVILNLGGD